MFLEMKKITAASRRNVWAPNNPRDFKKKSICQTYWMGARVLDKKDISISQLGAYNQKEGQL